MKKKLTKDHVKLLLNVIDSDIAFNCCGKFPLIGKARERVEELKEIKDILRSKIKKEN